MPSDFFIGLSTSSPYWEDLNNVCLRYLEANGVSVEFVDGTYPGDYLIPIGTSQKGFNTQLMGKDLLYWADTLLNLSKKGLENRDILNKHGKNETIFLDHLQKVIENKTTNADHMISKFSKNEDLSELYDK